MLNKSVARRYAEAFFSIALEQDKIDQYQQEFEKILVKINEIENLKEYFAHLLIPAKEKKELVVKIFADEISQLTLNFLLMVIDKRRETYIELIYSEFEEMADEARGIKKAEITIAKDIPDEEVKVLAENLSRSTGKKVQLKLNVDPALLGGIRIRMGDQVIDGSIAKKLEILNESLKQAKIS